MVHFSASETSATKQLRFFVKILRGVKISIESKKQLYLTQKTPYRTA
ncbi:MAG: hypothetical protein U5L45_18930 [Saprospiraceae bacterium]|nr:hypothetical protein [Saprospiraceae bacterium]